MATVSGNYTSATQYRVMASGLTSGQRYRLFVEDLNSNNQGTGYWYCHYAATLNDTQIDYRYRSVSYTGQRGIRLYQGTDGDYSVGSLYYFTDLPSTIIATGTISAYTQTYETGYVLIEREEGVAGYAYTYQLSGQPQSSSTTLENRTIYGDVGTDITITSFSYPDGKYSSPVKVTEYTDSSRTTVKKYWYWPTDKYIRINSGYRYIGFEASPKTCTLTYASGGSGVLGLPANQTVNYGTYVTVSNEEPTRAGYKFLGWSENAAAVVPDVYGGVGLYMTADRTLYAIWEKNAIERFYWNGSDDNDAVLIAKGQPVSNITATRWNNLLAKIKELADAVGAYFTYTPVSSGDGITADRYNVARTGLYNIKSQMGASITIPDAQESGNTMYAKLFNGSVSVKGALNNLIIIYNSEL